MVLAIVREEAVVPVDSWHSYLVGPDLANLGGFITPQ